MNKSSSPILGLGNDIIEIERIRKTLERHGNRFLDRIFTEKEQRYCLRYRDPASALAARFAAKEAVAKALGTGIGKHLFWHDIEIRSNAEGAPHVFLSDRAKNHFGSAKFLVSLSHCELYAMATAIWMS